MNKIVKPLFVLLVAALFVQITVYESATSSNTLLLYHLIMPLLLVATLPSRLSIRVSPDTVFFGSLVVTSLLCWPIYGFTTRGLLLPIAILAFAIGNRWHQTTTPDERMVTYQRVFLLVVAALVVRNLIHFDSLSAIYSRARTETPYFCLSSGGKNIEATQLGLLSTLLIGSTAFFPALAIAALTSLLVMSRSGTIAVLIALMLWLVHGRFGRIKLICGAVAISSMILACLVTFEGIYKVPIIERFDLSTERSYAADEQGRLAIWNAAVSTLREQPLGYGVGNGFRQLNDRLGGHLRENNAHNILIELALDGGIQSSLLFALILLSVLRAPDLISNPSHRCALAYGVLGLVEFTGYDAIGWFFIGISHASRTAPYQFPVIASRRGQPA